MLGHQTTRGFEIQHGAIQRAATALDHTQNQAGAGARRQAGQRLGFSAWHINSVGKVTGKRLAPLGQAVAQLCAEAFAFGIAAQQRLGHDHQLRAAAFDLVLVAQDLFKGCRLAVRQRTQLQSCHSRNRHYDHSELGGLPILRPAVIMNKAHLSTE